MAKQLKLQNKKIAILAADGFEQSELFSPKEALEQAGATVTIVSLKEGEVQGWNKKDWGKSIKVDEVVANTSAEKFDALMLPGGVMNPDQLRMNKDAVDFVKDFFHAGKPIGAICHAAWTLIEAGATEGLTMTSWPSLRSDLVNSGAAWVDEEVITDRGIVTSRRPEDLPAFNRKLIEEIAEGRHSARASKRTEQDQPRRQSLQ